LSAACAFGQMLREWRANRHMSQLDLALSAQVSARHISYVETGRSQPSREMVLQLSGALDVPLRERNALLQAAGFAPRFGETPLGSAEMQGVRSALRMILRQHEPFPAVAMDRHWNVVMANAPYLESVSRLSGREIAEPGQVVPDPRPNVLRLLFGSEAFRRHVVNWEEVAAAVLARVERDARWSGDGATRELLEELRDAPGAPPPGRWYELGRAPSLVIPVEVESPLGRLRYFTTMTTLGAALDVTLHELRIEAYHPADAETRERVATMARR